MNQWIASRPQERRAALRYPCDLPTVCRLSAVPDSEAWSSRVQNISLGGLALILGKQLQSGTPLDIELPGKIRSERRNVQIRVIHSRSRNAGDWLLGAAFPQQLNTDDLQAIAPFFYKPRLLVVEEELELRELLVTAFRLHGFRVHAAGSGREALSVYRQLWKEVDVVLLDVGMKGMDGPHTLAALRQINPKICCCYMTGGSCDYSEAELLHHGVVQVIYKPFSFDQVAHSLRQVIFQGCC